MRDMLPKKVYKTECWIFNLDSIDGNGAHWVCYYNNNKIKYYFDSYGKTIDKPPKELVTYLRKEIYFITILKLNDLPIWGYLCVFVIKEFYKKVEFQTVFKPTSGEGYSIRPVFFMFACAFLSNASTVFDAVCFNL